MQARRIFLIALSLASFPFIQAQESSATLESNAITSDVISQEPTSTTVAVPAAQPTPPPAVSGPKRVDPAKPLDLAMLAAATSTTLENGVRSFDYETGVGEEITSSSNTKFYFRLFLNDGTLVSSRYTEVIPAPLESKLTTDAVVPGLGEGMEGMKTGGIRYIELPPNLGYGSKGDRGVPPNSIIIFEIYVVGIQKGENQWLDFYNQQK